ncbi:hypothetical protein HPB48_003134 [Haemaphysalis longicornis]|uniref:Uncharacterized protein n=1 Tax=Haemaphysalis longicornis TaxID=44386 RepID=A0A9J6FA63_HAELO|nr:hypothetical protein HPB48_003134 [Haemaphysalis longicornis]
MPKATYEEKAKEAILKSFRLLQDVKPERVKKQAGKICKELSLSKMAASAKKSTALCLEVFFHAKTHKEGCPFRVIVSEEGSWQHRVGLFLQQCLSLLSVDDPYQIRRPQDVSQCLVKDCPPGLSVFSMDLKDICYSLPHASICEAVEEAIETAGTVQFHNACGISVGRFLELMS